MVKYNNDAGKGQQKEITKGVNEMKPLEIKGARTRLGISQSEVAKQLGMESQTYQKKESGKLSFTEEQKFQLAKILGLNPMQVDDWLFDGQFGVSKICEKLPEIRTLL